MRLTLRTMLAYLDDLLAPQDTEDIARKIAESEFAGELVHRTRDCMRRLRLGVPPMEGKGLASDPNTVADYLDNTLAADRVAEFEKICLESDVHLAEVASCHQILTLVLGEPAEIDPESRQRMYRIAGEVPAEAAPPTDAPPVQGETIQPSRSAASTAAPPAPPRRPKPEVPDYLREPRSRVWPVVAAAVGGAVVTIGLLFALGPAQLRERVVGTTGEEPSTDDTNQPSQPPAEPSTAEQPPSEPPAGPPDADTDEPAAAADARPAKTDLERPAEPTPIEADAPTAPEPADVPEEMPAGDSVEPNASAPAPADEPTVDEPTEESTPEAPESDPPAPDEPAEPVPDEPNEPTGSGPADTGFGRYTSKRGEVLLRLGGNSGDWMRLPPMSPLATGDQLLTLPVYRPTIALSTSISIQTDGACKLQLVGWTPAGVPVLSVDYGRLLMMTVGKAGNSIQLLFGEIRTELTFVDAESTIALEVRRLLPVGNDPTVEPAPLNVDLYATSGSVRVRVDQDPPIDIQAPARRALIGEGIAAPGEVPTWVESEALSLFDRQATTALEPMLPPDQFVGLLLKELAGHRKRDVRSLAIRSATYLDDFDSCVEALNEKDEKNSWPAYIDALRAAVARSPETATRVRNTLDKIKGADGEALFRMLWGYSADDLQHGAASELVEGLSHDSLDFRVVSIWALQQITGPANHGYYPENLAKGRTAAVNRWKELLRRGKIVPKSANKATNP